MASQRALFELTGPAAGSVHLDTQRTSFKLSGLAKTSLALQRALSAAENAEGIVRAQWPCRGAVQLEYTGAPFEHNGFAAGSVAD